MHRTDLPPEAVGRLVQRRGRLHIYDTLTGRSTALVVVDMQECFLGRGAPLEIPTAREIMPNINRLAEAIRRSGGVVVWLQASYTDEPYGGWKTYFDTRGRPEVAELILAQLTPGARGHRIAPELRVEAEDLVVLKYRYSAFVQGSSDLEKELRQREIDTVVVVGTLTNVCCESTARDAMQLGFRTVMVSDANATRTDDEHVATLLSIAQSFGDIRSTDEVIGLLGTPGDR
jgi:ureidoacrylate peracid hydrolase